MKSDGVGCLTEIHLIRRLSRAYRTWIIHHIRNSSCKKFEEITRRPFDKVISQMNSGYANYWFNGKRIQMNFQCEQRTSGAISGNFSSIMVRYLIENEVFNSFWREKKICLPFKTFTSNVLNVFFTSRY